MSPDEKLAHPENLKNKIAEFRPLHAGGQHVGDVNFPPAIRTLIAATAVESSVKEAAKAFDLSTAGAAKIVKKEIEAGRIESKEDKADKIKEKALDSLASLFDSAITADKLSGMKPREAISAAKDLAAVVERIAPKSSGGTGVTFVVFAPRVRAEEEYEAIDVTPQVDGINTP